MDKIIKGPWPEETHLAKHKRMFDSLTDLLADCQDVVGDSVPTDENGNIDWGSISVVYLMQYAMVNANKLTHEHRKQDDETNARPKTEIPV